MRWTCLGTAESLDYKSVFMFLFFIFYYLWCLTEFTRYCGHYWPIVPAPDDTWWWLRSNWWNEYWQGKPKYSEKTCPSATLSTTNPTWPEPGSTPGRRDGKPSTDDLSYGAACLCWIRECLKRYSLARNRFLCQTDKALKWIHIHILVAKRCTVLETLIDDKVHQLCEPRYIIMSRKLSRKEVLCNYV
jgi:hypothetical protein